MNPPWMLSNGEVHYLWHFVDGAIMEWDTRDRLRRGWGMCDRHSFGYVLAESAFRGGVLHGAALLYKDLMERARSALGDGRRAPALLIARRLRRKSSCLMCANGLGPRSTGYASSGQMRTAADIEAICRFTIDTERYWRRWVCGKCARLAQSPRCREHLREDLADGSASLAEQREIVSELLRHIIRYSRSFRWESQGTDTVGDRAALVGSVAWCSGWGPWLALTQR